MLLITWERISVLLAGMRLRKRPSPAESRRTQGMKNQFYYSFWNWVGFVFCVTTQMRVPRPH